MKWKFELIDRNGTTTGIDEPVGFSDMDITLKRDLEKHGIFTISQGSEFVFRNKAAKLLLEEYELHGIEGIYYLSIKQKCSSSEYEELFKGKIIFLHYDEITSSKLEIKLPVEKSSELITLLNKWNQKVDIESLKGFDGVNDLDSYNKIGYNIEMPSKAILLNNFGTNETANEAMFSTPADIAPTCIELGLQKTISAEIGSFFVSNSLRYDGIPFSVWGSAIKYPVEVNSAVYSSILVDYQTPIVNFSKEYKNVDSLINKPILINYRLKGVLHAINVDIRDCLVSLFIRKKDDSFITVHPTKIIYYGYTLSGYTPLLKGDSVEFDLTFQGEIFLEEGDRLYFLIPFTEYLSLPNPQVSDSFKIEIHQESFFNMTGLSLTKMSTTSTFLLNETMSRVTEIITNGKLKSYSTVFGRTDSQPYSTQQDGEFSLIGITDGIRIRNQEIRNNNKSLFNISLKDLWEGLNPMFNLGIGIEPDINRPNFNRLRIEKWNFFYQDDVIHACIGVSKINRKVIENEIFSQFKYGYEKWEAEEYTGLDEFLTNRTVRTTSDVTNNEFQQLSKFITSGYAIETSRRKLSDNSKDWKYDKSVFAIALSRKKLFHVKFDEAEQKITFQFVGDLQNLLSGPPGATGNLTITGTQYNNNSFTDGGLYLSNGIATIYISGPPSIVNEECFTVEFPNATYPSDSFFVENGRILNPENIIHPPSIFNWRLRPLYCAFRWLNKVFSSYKFFNNNSVLKFVDGEANYYAKGELASSFGKLENQSVSEKDDLQKNILIDESIAEPILKPERIEFDFPLSVKDFKIIHQNPKGKIYYEGECCSGYGYIDSIIYKPKQGMAKFSLIPKY